MCIRVIVGKYHCGHQRSPSHGIPDEFIRQCQDNLRFLACTIVIDEEDVPWLCSDCHWEYVKQHLAPLWQQITVTKCRVLQDVQIYPSESSYVNAQKEADRLNATFEVQQDAINNSAVSYHKLRDSTLRCFLAENFHVCLGHAHHAHRPWSLLYQQEPFARATADIDVDSSSPGPAHDHSDLQSPHPPAVETDQGVIQPNPPSVQPRQGLTDQDLPAVEPAQDINHPGQSTLEADQGVTHTDTQLETPPPHSPTTLSLGQAISDDGISDQDLSHGENGELRCLSCANRGSSYGVNVNQRICIPCQHGLGHGRGIGHGRGRGRSTFNGLDQGLHEEYDELMARNDAVLETLRSPTGGDNQRSLFGPDNQPTPPDLQPTLHTPDLSALPMTLSHFLAGQQENEYAFDADRVPYHTLGNLHASDVAIEGDEQEDRIALGRFFNNADMTQPEDAQDGQHVSDDDPEERPRQRRRLNQTEEEETTDGTGESSS
ncbi:hypothetical protein GJ744_002309 [Endocarpon pusillum]|uniref:Uncharacterized protein n=1 Tax=Endocarpon pusillum TaxID=364733 RepID=A0A8H7AQ18_9EURO|nr:hypothetical protein GJ744_002309 [Endocarpon pusillum]